MHGLMVNLSQQMNDQFKTDAIKLMLKSDFISCLDMKEFKRHKF